MNKIFSKKEAIVHGIDMVKKYFWFILIIMLIYAAFEISQGVLQNRAGKSIMMDKDIRTEYFQSGPAKDFKQFLVDNGFIDHYGSVQEKLEDLTDASQLELTAEFSADRTKIFNFLQSFRYRLPFPKFVYYILMLAFWLLGMVMSLGTTKISLLLSRDEKPEVSELFANYPFLLTYILSCFCYFLAVVGGFVLLIVPGIIFAIALGLNVFFIIDQNMGPMESLKASRLLTKGVRWQLFLFGFLIFFFNIAGALCLLVGLLWTVPASGVAMAYVYDKLREEVTPVAAS